MNIPRESPDDRPKSCSNRTTERPQNSKLKKNYVQILIEMETQPIAIEGLKKKITNERLKTQPNCDHRMNNVQCRNSATDLLMKFVECS